MLTLTGTLTILWTELPAEKWILQPSEQQKTRYNQAGCGGVGSVNPDRFSCGE